MRHRRKNSKLGVSQSHRSALLAHIVEGLIEHQRVRTTIDRAKEARRLAERLITIAKGKTLHARRLIMSELYSEKAAKKIFEIIGPAFSDVKGGFTRIVRESTRPGDGAQMVFLEFSKPIELAEPQPRERKKKSDGKPVAEIKGKEKKKWEDIPLVKKDSLEETKKEREKKAKKEERPESKGEEPQEEKKKGGFLSTLRKFLKGEK